MRQSQAAPETQF